jgi:trehalose 6-phosphate synthase/phosphatase
MEKLSLRQSPGGLVSAIKSYFDANGVDQDKFTEKIWAGVADFSPQDWEQMEPEVNGSQEFKLVPLFVEERLYNDYYNGFSNSILWPLFHYFSSLADYKTSYFDSYQQVNKQFAEFLSPLIQPDDVVWIHDYHLMLLPALLRSTNRRLTVGFFLHIPFPSYEIFRLLPAEWKVSLLEGMLGADLIGFHTYDYVQHFMQSLKMILGGDSFYSSFLYHDRLVHVDLFPIGIDFKKFNATSQDKRIRDMRADVRRNFEDKKMIFSVDRLDYSKGMMHRLAAIEYLFANYPQWIGNVVFILNMVPSRDKIQAYSEGKKMIEEKIGAVNGKYSTINWQPVIYRYNHLSFIELAALYQAADAALITPLRDGMNLVAKEYVASCATGRGVLILSELTGVASELSEAIQVNPTDVQAVAYAINQALTMPLGDQRYRMRLMQKRLQDYDVVRWVNDFFDQLAQVKRDQEKLQIKFLSEKVTAAITRNYQHAENRCLLLDYDGTLIPLAGTPAGAVPGTHLRKILMKLSSDPRNNIVIISGREAETLENWFGSMHLSLVAEHGAAFKCKNGRWQEVVPASTNWKEQVRPLLLHFERRCPGSFIEEKVNTIAWHYRNTQPDLGFSRSRELLNNLSQLVQNSPLQLIDGNKVIEVRNAGLDKGAIVRKIINETAPDFVLCIGDDTTDEDMFKALDSNANSIKVGVGATAARHSIVSQSHVLPFLNQLAVPVNEMYYAST